ncbi:MAG: hypothetical protein E4H33_02735 [Anaerolineales bacterium]|nr:MAG: hypothetical protein E4H33_02735 [Anaerolineales bacterium]
MKTKKLLLIMVIVLLLAANTFIVAAATGFEPPHPAPECGTYTWSFSDANVKFEYVGGPPSGWTFTSYNGWAIVQITWEPLSGPVILQSYPPGTTSVFDPESDEYWVYSVNLKKNCSCRPTGSYVYTLLGNYPCNLITTEDSIPARFLDPAYTGPLCNLPNLDHVWNGEWVKNEEMDCGGYFVGGNHYDTSLGILP